MLKRLSGLAACLCLTACATAYQSSGATGGHHESPGPGQMQLVSFSGNGYISAELVQQYALFRCAELAQAKGKAYFLLYDLLGNAARDVPAALPLVGTIQNKPAATAFLLLLDEPRRGALETKAVLEQMRKVLKEQQPQKT